MGEVSREQVLELLFEVADDLDKLEGVLVEMRTLNHEMALGNQRLSEASFRSSGKVSPA